MVQANFSKNFAGIVKKCFEAKLEKLHTEITQKSEQSRQTYIQQVNCEQTKIALMQKTLNEVLNVCKNTVNTVQTN